ncbi:MAG: hypothetical protein O7A09_01225, partial [Proteobacteria bacterium]|nr:hypothetical protein [Pseudomonadota bacterium]
DTVLADHPYRGAGHLPGERIDYVFVRDGERATARPVSVERTFDEWLDFDGQRGAHSDHAGLRAEIEIGPRAPSVLPGPDPEAIAEAREWLEWGRNEARERQGRRRRLAGGGFAGAVAAGGGAVALRGDRRTILRVVLWAACAAGLSVAGLATLIAQRTVPAELVGYDRVEAALDALAGA